MFMKRSPIKRRKTKKAAFLEEAAKKAKAIYFMCFGYLGPDFNSCAPCQISGRLMFSNNCDWAHLYRRHKGRHGVKDCVIASRLAHNWMDHKPEREKFARESGVSAESGGVIPWPKEMKDSLEMWLNEGIDKINLGGKK